MSYDIKLSGDCNHRIIEEDQIIESDYETVVVDRLIVSANVKVKINDFERKQDFQSEKQIHEIITDFKGDGRTFFVANGPIYDGLKIGNLANSVKDVIVKIKIENEDLSSQITGHTSFLVLNNKPLLKANKYDFVSATTADLEIQILNSISEDVTDQYEIIDLDSKNGRIEFDKNIEIGCTILITYFYKATVESLDALNSKIILSEIPMGLVTIQYYTRYQDGWFLNPSTKSLITNARDIVFYQPKKTVRNLITREDVSNQFSESATDELIYTSNIGGEQIFQLKHTKIVSDNYLFYRNSILLEETVDYTIDFTNGILTLVLGLTIGDVITGSYSYRINTKNSFFTEYKPLLPLYQNFYDTYNNTLNNAVVVLKVIDVTDETISRINDNYKLRNTPVLSNSYFLYKNSVLLVEGIDFNINLDTGQIEFLFSIDSSDILKVNYQYGIKFNVSTINPATGEIKLYERPGLTDKVTITYYYQNLETYDRIGLDYTTSAAYCPKCIKISAPLFDYKLDGLGQYFKVWREDKLVQDGLKIIQTIKGSDPVALWYGTSITKIIGVQLFPEYVKTKITSELIEAFTRLKNAQIQQEEYQEVDPKEFIDFINSISVIQDPIEITFYKAIIDLVTQSGTNAPITTQIPVT